MNNQKMTTQALPMFSLAILIGLGLFLALYGKVLLVYNQTAHLGMSGLFFLGVGCLLWERYKSLVLKRQWSDILLGIGLACVTLVITASLLQQYKFPAFMGGRSRDTALLLMRSLPLLSGLTAGILALGLAGLKQIWRELAILAALGIPGIIAKFVTDISPITAKFTAFLLWLGRVDYVREGLVITLPGGAIEVYSGCSGLESMAYLLGLSALLLIMFPIKGVARYFIPFVGVALAFVINGIRVALMAVLVGANNMEAFDYWHEGDGSLLFGMAAIVAFSAFYMGLENWEKRTIKNNQ